MAKEEKPKTAVFVTTRLFDNGEAQVEFLKTGEKGYSKRVGDRVEPVTWFGVYTAADLESFKAQAPLRGSKRDISTFVESVIKITPQTSNPDIIIYTAPHKKRSYGIRKVLSVKEE